MVPEKIKLNSIGEVNTGYISLLEGTDLPFDIKRSYWIYSTPDDIIRGKHAHKELQQIIIAVSGEINFKLEDRFNKQYNISLKHPSEALFLPPFVWREITLSKDAVLICFASKEYNELEYIRNYDEFQNLIKKYNK